VHDDTVDATLDLIGVGARILVYVAELTTALPGDIFAWRYQPSPHRSTQVAGVQDDRSRNAGIGVSIPSESDYR
jgi:hypothetical protein